MFAAGEYRGLVEASGGAPVAEARVTLTRGGKATTVRTDGAGRFLVADPSSSTGGPAVIVISASGFEPLSRTVALVSPDLGVFTLSARARSEEVLVTASRAEGRLADTSASVTLLRREDLAATAAPSIDDLLRQVPGFSLFRRTGSRTANPTAQGVSLRGVGASGASRAAVLFDGVPLADPFGGWIYWTALPRLAVERVEVVRGGGSSLYGSDAVGGVVNLIPRGDPPPSLAAEASIASASTADGSLAASGSVAGFTARAAGELSRTDGFFIVGERDRGAVDTRAEADFGTLHLALDHALGEGGRIFVRGSYFSESRNNGTALQMNDTRVRALAGGADRRRGRWAFGLRIFGSTQTYNQTFTSITATRATESLIRRQRTPARQLGLTSQASTTRGRHTLVFGADARRVRGFTNETAITAGRSTAFVEAGGQATFRGLFGQDAILFGSRVLLTIGARVDRWSHTDGEAFTTTLSSGARSGVSYAPRRESALDPRVAALIRLTPSLSFTVSGYRAFRAPTLNELYRAFRVGNVSTLANATLRAETFRGLEGGLAWENRKRTLRARAALFLGRVTDPIVNATLSATPDLITRQRQNLGANRSWGLESEVLFDPSRALSVSVSYMHLRARVDEAPANRALEGLDLPQSPRHQLTAQVRYEGPRGLRLALQARGSGRQFDDDQNLLPLSGYAVVDLLASKRLAGELEVFFAGENLFDRRYETGRAGVTTIGMPRGLRAGLRYGLR